jgi:hypothetical protein
MTDTTIESQQIAPFQETPAERKARVAELAQALRRDRRQTEEDRLTADTVDAVTIALYGDRVFVHMTRALDLMVADIYRAEARSIALALLDHPGLKIEVVDLGEDETPTEDTVS